MTNGQRRGLCWRSLAMAALAFAAAPGSALAVRDACAPSDDLDGALAIASVSGPATHCRKPTTGCGAVARTAASGFRNELTDAVPACPWNAGDALVQQSIEAPSPSAGMPPLGTVRAALGESLEPVSAPSLPDSWKTSEYSRSATVSSRTGASRLNMINAAEGYARRVTGRVGGGGVTVAIIDDGVNDDHPQLDVASAFEFGSPGRRHGTLMAGVIAARRDGEGIHGVAFNANLVSLGRVSAAASVEASAADIASAAGLVRVYGTHRSNPDASSHILNMSWGETGPVPVIQSAMRDAAGAGRIMVASLGNHGGVEPHGAPAIHVADEGIAGFAIAAGYLNQAGAGRHANADNCGAVARYCLFAPGTNVLSTAGTSGENVDSGSSYSAAYVSGAAAVVWAAFPNKRGDQIVGRLLSTARPLDGAEISSTYGHGALDLGAAMNPVGFLSLSLNGGGRAPLASSFFDLPPGFAAPSADAALANAVVYDQQQFPFLTDLNAVFRTAPQRPPEGLVEPPSWLPNGVPASAWRLGHGGLGHPGQAFPTYPWAARTGWGNPGSYRMALRPTPNLSLALSKGFGAFAAPNDFIARRTRRNPLRDQFSSNPFAALTGWGDGLSLSWRLGRRTALDFASKRGEGYFGAARSRFAAAGLARDLGVLTLGAYYGFLDESGSRLGVRSQGAFGGSRDARTAFLHLRIEGRPAQRLRLFGSLAEGATAGGSGRPNSLIARWSKARSRSFLLGGEIERLWLASDRLTFTAAMPFRVRQAKVHLHVPDRELADGVVHYRRQAVNLRPRGREIQLQLSYAAEALQQRLSLALGASLRLQPNHAASAGPEFGAALRMRLVF